MSDTETNQSSKELEESDQTFELKFDIPGSTKTLIEYMIEKQNLILIRRIANKNGWNYKDLIRFCWNPFEKKNLNKFKALMQRASPDNKVSKSYLVNNASKMSLPRITPI